MIDLRLFRINFDLIYIGFIEYYEKTHVLSVTLWLRYAWAFYIQKLVL